MPTPERTRIQGGLEIPRLISGLWQLAGGHDKSVNIVHAAEAMNSLIDAGLNCFDMADHYGDAELVIGQHNSSYETTKSMVAFTKWCPTDDSNVSFENAERAVDLALLRMDQKHIALMQYHIWSYDSPSMIHNLAHLTTLQQQGKIGLIGLTNTDAAHLCLLIDSGFKIATNQISCSVIDRRYVRGPLLPACTEHNVGILAYGTLLGGFLSEKWLGAAEPSDMETLNWSLRKYLRFIQAAGGWGAFQGVLLALSLIGKKHHVGIAAIATRYVLDLPNVKAVIVGSRLSTESEKYTARNVQVFSFKLDESDRKIIAEAQEGLRDIPGDCGDEYRRKPFLTASGDLSHHFKHNGEDDVVTNVVAERGRVEYSSGSKWESIAGYCRAVRNGNSILVSGTTANSPLPSMPVLGGESARSQTVAILDTIEGAIKALGGQMSDVVRTRIIVRNEDDVEEISRAHGWVFGCHGIRPANMLILAGLVGSEFLVEIEADAVVGCGAKVVRI